MSAKIKDSVNFFFSIITPNYNSGEKLLRAIMSLRKNSISFEHIIIDDCSTDDSFSSIEKLRDSSSLSNLVLFSNLSNSGPGASRNKGLDFARGEYIIFLDADDYFLDNALDTLYSIIKSKEKIDVLLFNYYMLTNTKYDLGFPSYLDDVFSIDDPIRDYLLDEIISSPWCKCIKSDLAKKFRFPDLRVSEDAIYNLDIFINAENVFKIDTILYVFDKTESNSLTRKVFDKKEFMKFHKGWVAFEEKALIEIQLKNSHRLLASRKIRFEVLYYLSRMIVSPDSKVDKFIINSIRETIRNNIILARDDLSAKIKLLCFMFYFFPSLTIRLVKLCKVF